jgi:hypothetical protein
MTGKHPDAQAKCPTCGHKRAKPMVLNSQAAVPTWQCQNSNCAEYGDLHECKKLIPKKIRDPLMNRLLACAAVCEDLDESTMPILMEELAAISVKYDPRFQSG